jgi:hypothetical protein
MYRVLLVCIVVAACVSLLPHAVFAQTGSVNTFLLPFRGMYTISAGPCGHHLTTFPAFNARAIDFELPRGTEVRAVEAGVVYHRTESGGGNMIVIDHRNGLYSSYAHLSERINVGTRVTRGQAIGKSGNSGNVTGPHLHFAVHTNVDTRKPTNVVIAPNSMVSLVTMPGLYWRAVPGERNYPCSPNGVADGVAFATDVEKRTWAVNVPATVNVQATGIRIARGQTVEVRAGSGRWTIQNGRHALVNARGYVGNRPNWTKLSSANLGQVIARVGNGSWQVVTFGDSGPDGERLTRLTGVGELQIAINDGWTGDNAGAIVVGVQIK